MSADSGSAAEPAERGPVSLTEPELDFLLSVFDMAREGSTDRLEEVLDAGIPPNLTNSSGDSLLMLAAYHEHLESVELLLAHGADVARVNDRGQTALAAAVFRQQPAIVTALLQAGADPNGGERSARSIAQFFGLDKMQQLLNHGVSGGAQDDGENAATGDERAAATT